MNLRSKIATITCIFLFSLVVVQKSAAHVIKLTAKTPGLKIAQLEGRVSHDRLIVKRRGEWKPIGKDWLMFVRYTINSYELRTHQHDLRIASRLLARLRPLLGDQAAWGCIHSHEGAWTDGGWPFLGGLQFDSQFVRTYGGDMLRYYGNPVFTRTGVGGWLNAWHPYDQQIVAERARRSGRGYYPWPNTARVCGLI